jgi:hypothetical protein
MGLTSKIAPGPRQRSYSDIAVKYITNIVPNKSLNLTARCICSGIHGYEQFLVLHVYTALSLKATEKMLLFHINQIMKDF